MKRGTTYPITLTVNDRAVSKMIGHKKGNLMLLRERGFDIAVAADSTVPLWEVAVSDRQKGSST